jgi:hypothetical protein
MAKSVSELLESLPSRDFYISKEIDDKYLKPMVEEIWKSLSIKKGEIVHYSVLVAYTAWERRKIDFDPQKSLTTTFERTKGVDLGRIYEFLSDQELTLYISILLKVYGSELVGEDFPNCFKAIRQLAEKGLELLYSAVSDEVIVDESIRYMEDLEALFSKLSEMKIV